MFSTDDANLMKSNLLVDIFVQTESNENEFKTYKAITQVFLSSRSPVMLANEPPMPKSNDD